MNSDLGSVYVNLLKKTLTFTLWPEPPLSLKTFNSARPLIIRAMVNFCTGIFKIFKMDIVKVNTYSENDRTEGKLWPGYADTMIGTKRLDNVQYCVETVIKEKIPGDLIETGVWRGGTCIFMKGILKSYNVTDRKIYLADSFEGLPKPDLNSYPADKGEKLYSQNYLAVSLDEVKQNFIKYDLLDENIVFLKGWFKDTLPSAPIDKLSVLRLDGDMYSSTIEALENLYPKLSKSGFCIIDDFHLPGCVQAVNDYRSKNGINAEIVKIDWAGVYWRKE